MQWKRVILLAGHYGSGKTNLAVNLAAALKKQEKPVVIADLDIVNPYYRTKDSEEELKRLGIPLISSPYANSNVDVPALPQELYTVVDRTDTYAVVDVGGDDRGALALGRYTPKLLEEDNFEMLFVMNMYRPLTKEVSGTLEVMREIEIAGGLPFSALVNNSNLGAETTAHDVVRSVAYAEAVSKACGLPVKMTSVMESLYSNLREKIPNVVPLRLQNKRIWN